MATEAPTAELSVKSSYGAMEVGNRSSDDSDSSTHKRTMASIKAGAQSQTMRLAKVALADWNKHHESKGVPEYVLVLGEASVPFWKDNSWWSHINFTARRKDDPASKPETFFAEVKGQIWGKRHKVTKNCVLLPTESGPYDCRACAGTLMHHPASGGFNLGQKMYNISDPLHKNVKKRKELEAREKNVASRTSKEATELEAREKNVASRTSKEATELEAREKNVASRTRSKTPM